MFAGPLHRDRSSPARADAGTDYSIGIHCGCRESHITVGRARVRNAVKRKGADRRPCISTAGIMRTTRAMRLWLKSPSEKHSGDPSALFHQCDLADVQVAMR